MGPGVMRAGDGVGGGSETSCIESRVMKDAYLRLRSLHIGD